MNYFINQNFISFYSMIGRLQPPPVFYQPNTRVDENLSREITVAIGSRLETGDNEETIRVTFFISTNHNLFFNTDVECHQSEYCFEQGGN